MLDPEIKKSLLAAKPLCYLDLKELDRLVAYTKIVTFSSGQVLQQQGKMSEGLYIIIKGSALVSARTLGTELINLAILTPGDFIGDLIEKKISATSVTANSQLECLLITNEYFDMLSIFFPEMKYKITKAIAETVCQRLRVMHDKILSIIKESSMTSQFTFGEIIKSLTRPKETTFIETNIKPDDIKNSELFKSLTKDDFEIFLKNCNLIKANRYCDLIKENEQETSYFVILRGAVQLSVIYHKKLAKLTVLGPLAVMCGISYIDDQPSIFSYETCERAILLQLSAEHLHQLHDKNIILWYKIYDSICRTIVSLEEAANRLYLRLNSEFYNRKYYV